MSRSPRRKTIKALDLERKQVRRAGDAYRYQLHLEADAFIKRHQKELSDLREKFAPTLERLISVSIGVPFKVAAYRRISHEALKRDATPAVSEVYTIDTVQKVRMCIDFSPHVVMFAFGGDGESWRRAERELQYAAGTLVAALMDAALTGRGLAKVPA